jgi:hypothetical protein
MLQTQLRKFPLEDRPPTNDELLRSLADNLLRFAVEMQKSSQIPTTLKDASGL